MADDVPRPQYGEYATPEQVAAAMGKRYVPPAIMPPPPAAEDRQEVPAFRLPGNAIDRFATIFQLGIGLVFLLNSDYFHTSQSYDQVSTLFGVAITISSAINSWGWALLTGNIVLLLLTAVWALLRLRHGKLAFWVPILGFAVFDLCLTVVLAIFTRS
ncbi:MAG TPA: DUF6264 family protein [Galbitalea sp.]